MQNLRARAYDPACGRFIGLDPFAGNMQDPQSLHKYAYVHGDPIMMIDPTGESALGSISLASFISVGFASLGGAAYGAAKGYSHEQILQMNLQNSAAAIAVTLGFFGVAYGLIGLGAAAADAFLFSSISFGVGGATLSGANFAQAFKQGDGVDKIFATFGLLLSLAGLRLTHIAAVNQTQRQTAISGALLERINALGTQEGKLSGAAGVIYDPTTERFYGGRSTTAGGNSQKISDWVRDLYDAVDITIRKSQGKMHMSCVEPRALSAARPELTASDRADLNKMWSAVVRMKDAMPRPACKSCDPVLKELGVRDAFVPNTDVHDMGIVNWIIGGLFGDISDEE